MRPSGGRYDDDSSMDYRCCVVCSRGQITSQVPYFEDFIGPPHTYTVDYDDVDALRAVLDNITSSSVSATSLLLFIVSIQNISRFFRSGTDFIFLLFLFLLG